MGSSVQTDMLTPKEQTTTAQRKLKYWNSELNNTVMQKERTTKTLLTKTTSKGEEQRDRQPGRRETYHLSKEGVLILLSDSQKALMSLVVLQ